mmetsp:Transcript_9425/g.27513  ORF Transcript_9425/g.27513 Transcript_9425/m.27513 type:complete len:303 (+) Transcript_9425:610-1518(+)
MHERGLGERVHLHCLLDEGGGLVDFGAVGSDEDGVGLVHVRSRQARAAQTQRLVELCEGGRVVPRLHEQLAVEVEDLRLVREGLLRPREGGERLGASAEAVERHAQLDVRQHGGLVGGEARVQLIRRLLQLPAEEVDLPAVAVHVRALRAPRRRCRGSEVRHARVHALLFKKETAALDERVRVFGVQGEGGVVVLQRLVEGAAHVVEGGDEIVRASGVHGRRGALPLLARLVAPLAALAPCGLGRSGAGLLPRRYSPFPRREGLLEAALEHEGDRLLLHEARVPRGVLVGTALGARSRGRLG